MKTNQPADSAFPPSSPDHPSPAPALSPRRLLAVLVIGCFLAWVLARWIEAGELVVFLSQISEAVPPIPALAALLLLISINPLLHRVSPRLSLSRGQLLAIYIFCAISVAMAGPGMVRPFIPAITATQYFSESQPELRRFLPFLKSPFFQQDQQVVLGLYEGTDTERVPWTAWLVPLGLWIAFLFALYFTMLCVFTLLRRQWIEKERLTFPLLELPLRLTEETRDQDKASSFFRNPLMWVGFLAALLFNVTNMLHAFDPSVPAIGISFPITFQERPWSALSTSILFYLSVMGLAYLVPTEVLAATWVCYWLLRVEGAVALTIGYEVPGWPGDQYQAVGGYIALLGAILWIARHQIKEVLVKALRGHGHIDDKGESLPCRTAFAGALLGFAFLVGSAVVMGMGWGMAVILFGIIICFGVVYAKLRCEAGAPLVWSYPYDVTKEVLIYPFGSRLYSLRSLTIWSVFNFLTRGYWLSTFAFQIEGLKLAEQSQVSKRQMALVIMVATLAGLITAIWVHIAPSYQIGMNLLQGGGGGGTGSMWVSMASGQLDNLAKMAKDPFPPEVAKTTWSVMGFFTTLVLVALRRYFFRFPLHPMGFALASTWGGGLWSPFFFAWLIKVMVVRLGGLRLYGRVKPAFLGVMFGHFFFSAVWSLVGLINPEWGNRYLTYFG